MACVGFVLVLSIVAKIEIKKEILRQDGWEFLVAVSDDEGEIEYEVIARKSYWENLTRGECSPEDFVKNSFEFLLEREPKESILRKFNLHEINRYFPEYEEEIKCR